MKGQKRSMITTILFDLDGTLLSMDQDEFVQYYFAGLCRKMAPYGYEPKELTEQIWKGTAAMMANRSEKTNEEVFWECMMAHYGQEILDDMPVFEEFYQKEFQQIAQYCPPKERALKALEGLKGKYRLVLATNPIFPDIATKSRMRWAGLAPEDFAMVTTYENAKRSKPNPEYFLEILRKLNLKPEECLMVGNDAEEDGAALQAGIPLFLIEDHLINRKNRSLDDIAHGSFADLPAWIEKMAEEKA